MKELGLDLLGLPAARLHNEVDLIGNTDFHLVARGGPSYQSCAAIWRKDSHFQFDALNEVGSNCRLWISTSFHGEIIAFCAVVALPPQGGAEKESLWHEELKGLCRDIALLKLSCTNCRVPPCFLVAGEFNVQPSRLAGAKDLNKPQRDDAIESLLQEHALTLLNPLLAGDSPHPSWLPLHG